MLSSSPCNATPIANPIRISCRTETARLRWQAHAISRGLLFLAPMSPVGFGQNAEVLAYAGNWQCRLAHVGGNFRRFWHWPALAPKTGHPPLPHKSPDGLVRPGQPDDGESGVAMPAGLGGLSISCETGPPPARQPPLCSRLEPFCPSSSSHSLRTRRRIAEHHMSHLQAGLAVLFIVCPGSPMTLMPALSDM